MRIQAVWSQITYVKIRPTVSMTAPTFTDPPGLQSGELWQSVFAKQTEHDQIRWIEHDYFSAEDQRLRLSLVTTNHGMVTHHSSCNVCLLCICSLSFYSDTIQFKQELPYSLIVCVCLSMLPQLLHRPIPFKQYSDSEGMVDSSHSAQMRLFCGCSVALFL